MAIQNKLNFFGALTMFGAAIPTGVSAQEQSPDLATSDVDALRGSIQARYDAALSATRDEALIAANDTRYVWASEAKVQCAIALGFLRSNTRDETSISKCDYAFRMMSFVATPPTRPTVPVVQAPPPPPEVCEDVQPGLIFFDFDVDVPGSDARQTIQFFTGNAEVCGWERFNVVGHTDRAGSNTYNDNLSFRRAQSVAGLMTSLGIDMSDLNISAEGELNPRVPTADGIRSPENRRVEISVSQ